MRFIEIVGCECGFGVLQLQADVGGLEGGGSVEILGGFGEVSGFRAVEGELEQGVGDEKFVLVGGFGELAGGLEVLGLVVVLLEDGSCVTACGDLGGCGEAGERDGRSGESEA